VNGASKTLISLLKSSCPPNTIIGGLNPVEKFPMSFAVDPNDRRMLERVKSDVHPWDSDEALKEIHRKGYYPRSSRKNEPSSGEEGISRWPEILRSCIQGGATLALQSFGAALYYLQTSLIDAEILSMGIIKPYCPPNNVDSGIDKSAASDHLQDMYSKEAHQIDGRSLVETEKPVEFGTSQVPAPLDSTIFESESNIDHMSLDGRTLTNLEILNNITSGGYQGSLLSKIDATQSPHGSRLLRAWLLRPLFRKVDIDRRADVVEELLGGAVAVAMAEARPLLKKIGDIERLLSRVHSMSGGGGGEGGNEGSHPNDRAVLYEMDKHTKRKVGDFSKLLNGLRAAAEIPDLFANAEIQSPMLEKIVRTTDENGCFPAEMKDRLDWFFDNFDLKKAARGEFEPSRGMDDDYDAACNEIEDIQRELQKYKDEMCSSVLQPRNTARSSWKYINVKEDSKDKYLIELPISVQVPDDFYVKAKRGKGANQVNKYRTPVVEQLVQDLERAIDVKNARKAAGMKLVFAKFDSMRSVWMAAAHATAMLDALGSLAQIASQPGFCRPQIVDCPPSAKPGIEVIQGRHPCVDVTHSGGDFIPNDLILGGKFDPDGSSVLLLSGPNMGGKSTLLRQTCLITILAQVGSFVPAERCSLTPIDRIFTRLGASDRILCGQSTFFVELAETAAAVRGATRRSLVIMDELGRGTSTFDGTAIASATVQHLVERNQCLTLFATHYHSLLEDWKNEPSIRLGHMECVVEDNDDDSEKKSIAFLYTLGEGPCPKSFGVNVARLAGLPDDVLERAKRVSVAFEAEMNGESNNHKIIPSEAEDVVNKIEKLFSQEADVNHSELKRIWEGLQ
jgi:DNA mismatch repair protein MSH6